VRLIRTVRSATNEMLVSRFARGNVARINGLGGRARQDRTARAASSANQGLPT
jgi:hypothetical protein